MKVLTGTVQRVGSLKKVSASDTDAACADLRITLTGGTAGVRAQTEIVVNLNTNLGSSGRTAQLIDETAASPPVWARKSGNRYVFGPVNMPPTGTGIRVFRITNVRIDGTQLPTGLAGSRQIQASGRITNVRIDGTQLPTGLAGGATPIQAQILYASVSISSVLLSNSKQAVASVSVLRT